MKKMLLILVVCTVFSCKYNNQTTANKSVQLDTLQKQAAIVEVQDLIVNSFQEIWSNLDTTAIQKYHTKDFILLENGAVWNNDTIANYMNKQRVKMAQQQFRRSNRFNFIKAVHNNGSIWIAYDNYGTFIKGTDTLRTIHWLESGVAIKENNTWKLQQLHSTYVNRK
ncbi:hypothetical protein ACFQ5N_10185 [Lutibacter holmesii]|uniref:Nuclear transport factor 2 family protein n=1 Tax=Lutibacter holmesii TaxID=1137985 RepID=A0ABW3WPM3_9FLAO